MKSSVRQPEIDFLGILPWGTHFCMFYQTQDDLLDILIPYFKAGLENNEYCVLITSEPLEAKDVEKAMRMTIPKFDTYLQKNQIEFIPYTEWYLENDEFNSQRALNGWLNKCNYALDNGFNGLRTTGNLFWVDDKYWKTFVDYEEKVNEVIKSYKMIAVCTYSLEKCGSFEILDVVRNHQYALFRREGTWEIFKSSDQIKYEEKLKESEQRLKSFINSATDGFVLFDSKLNYIDMNNVTLQSIGMTREEIIGKNILDITPNLKETGRYDQYLEVIKTGEPFSTENAIFNRVNGSLEFHFSVRAFKVGDNLGMIFTDITESKKVELKLREGNIELSVLNKIITLGNESTSLQEFLENSYYQVLEVVNFFDSGGIYLYDPETNHNRLVLHRNIHPDFIAAVEDIDMSKEPFNKVFDKNNPYYIEDFSEFMEGSKDLGVYSVVIVPLRSKDEYIGSLNVGSHKHQILSQKDLKLLIAIGKQMGLIIQKFESEKLLKESEEKYRMLFESSTDGITSVDMEGRIIDVNNVYLKMLGYSKEELLKLNFRNITPQKWHEMEDNLIASQLSEGGESIIYEKECIKKDGTIFPINARFWIIKDVQGDPVRIWVIVRDITERKHVEEKLRELNKLKSEFLRRASHELKTPLISIKGFSELILSLHEDQLEPSIISKLREINAGCERLQNIIDNLLKTSRLESPELRPSKHREDLSFLINFCVLELESMAESRRQSIKLDVHDYLYANIEKEEIHDVLSNLLSNAIKYTPPMGKIEIKTELKEDFVVVSVKDNGIGFTDDQKKKIFQQFGKIERYGQGLDLGIDGTGLGLFISKRIVESHGGKIWMESEGKNMGSTFYFSLPKKIE